MKAPSNEQQEFVRSIKRKDKLVLTLRLLVLVGIIGLWELAAQTGLVDPFIMSSPSRVAATLASLWRGGELFLHIGVTLFETVAGFVIGTLIGTLLAALLWWLPTLNRVLDPYLVVLNALPKIALGPVLIVWVGAGMESIIVMAVLISFVVTCVTVLNGFLTASEERQFLMRTLGATRMQTFMKVVLPASVPDMVSAIKISVGMSWVGVIVGEYLVSRAGLGYLIVYGGQVFKLDLVMTSVVILCLLAAGMYFGVVKLSSLVIRDKK